MNLKEEKTDAIKKKGMALSDETLHDVAGGVVRIWYEDPSGQPCFRDIISDGDKDFLDAIDDDPAYKIVGKESL